MIPQYVGVKLLEADGTPVTIGATVQVSFDADAFDAPTNPAAHTQNGWWRIQLTTAERNSGQVEVDGSGGGSVGDTRTYVNIPTPADMWAATTRQLTGVQSFNNDGQTDQLPTENTLTSGSKSAWRSAWQFNATTGAADPGLGYMKLNNAALASATALYLNFNTVENFRAHQLIMDLPAGTVIELTENVAGVSWARYTLDATPTDNGGWYTLAVTHVASSGSFIADALLWAAFTAPAGAVDLNPDQSGVTIGTLAGDVEGKVLGGGVSAITGTGVRSDQREIQGSTSASEGIAQTTRAIKKDGTVAASPASTTTRIYHGNTIVPTHTSDDQWPGQSVYFLDDTTTVALRGAHAFIAITGSQATPGYWIELDASKPLPVAPASTDTFVIT